MFLFITLSATFSVSELFLFIHSADKFVFVSYNILGVENASKHRDLYYKVPRNFLDWNHRKKLICEELTSYNPSILSFQASLSFF